uniref:sodium-dependent phosphate transport protein 1-like n=1 Tax=Jaculus jaculus TaxID=51337 RepID=UPI001E1B599E|nr:sodium-dependent phosphate transport protein 1-like [Jaculus jaculus]
MPVFNFISNGDVLFHLPVPGFCSFRYGLALLLHFVNMGISGQHTCLSLTIVTMVNRTDTSGVPNASAGQKLDDTKNPVYNWSPGIQGVILSSFSYGAIIAYIPVGYLSGRFPVKKWIGSAVFLSSVFSLLTPGAAHLGPALFIVCRALQGLSQGIVIAAQNAIWVKWAPTLERGRLISVSYSGFKLGSFLVMLGSGFICDLLGWPMVFYILGAFGCVLSLLWFILFYEEPKDHPWISIREKEYINSSLAQQVSSRRQRLPIKAMLKSLPVWAITLSVFAYMWSASLFAVYTPTYLSTMLHINMRENGLLSGLPHLCAYICGIVAGEMADFFHSRKIFSLLTIRKLFTTLGLLLPVIFSLSLLAPGLGFHGTVTLLVLASASLNFSMVGGFINVLDIAPRYYGFLNGVEILVGTVGSMTSPLAVGHILSQWMDSKLAEEEERHQMENQPPPRKVPGFCSFCYGLGVLLHFVNVAVMAQVSCINLTIVAMVNGTDTSGMPNASAQEKLDDTKNPVYNWSPGIQGVILSSFSYGAIIAYIPIGYLSGRFPVKKLVGSALFLSSVFSLLTPGAARLGPALLIVCRVLQGISQGTVHAAQHATWVRWAPPLERGRLASISYSGEDSRMAAF